MSQTRVLVTGALGFLGGALARYLAHKGVDVIGVDQRCHLESPCRILPPLVDFIDREELPRAFPKSVQAIFHLGAVTNTYETDWNVLEKWNLEFSKLLWNIGVEENIPFYYASSAATYGGGAQGFDDEEEKLPCLLPLNLYGKSKHLFDLWVFEKSKASSPPSWAGFKIFNAYGPYEFHKGEMASMAFQIYLQLLSEGKVRLFQSHSPHYSHGGQRRDFIYVDDILEVFYFAWKKPIEKGIYNLGTGTSRSFLDLALCVARALKLPLKVEFVPMPLSLQRTYQYYTCASLKRLRKAGYRSPFLPLEEGVKRYVKKLQEGREKYFKT